MISDTNGVLMQKSHEHNDLRAEFNSMEGTNNVKKRDIERLEVERKEAYGIS
jgi:hypothetical protein